MAHVGEKRPREELVAPEGLPPAKVIKLDENDIDFMIGDLTKEESHLVLTRVLRTTGEDAMRRHIELVRHSRKKLTEEQINKQVEQLRTLRTLQSACSPMVSDEAFLTGMPMMSPSMSPYQAKSKGLSKARLRGIKNRVRDSFKKQTDGAGRQVHHINASLLEEDLQRGKDDLLKGNLSMALAILEAITEEVVDRASQVDHVSNLSEALELLGSHWLDAFLSEAYDVPDEEREDWAEKLRSWDTSAEEVSPLSCARAAARKGWQDPVLVKVLAGQPLDEEEELHEPHQLSVARLSSLEREKKLTEAYHLAVAVKLEQHAAKFLMKLNRVDEAVQMALRLTDDDKLFATAQIARPIDAKASVRLAVASLARSTSGKFFQSRNVKPRMVWLCDLAITESLLKDVLQYAAEEMVSKAALRDLCFVLAEKARLSEAVQIATSVLTPYTKEQLLVQYEAVLAAGVLSRQMENGVEEDSSLYSAHRLTGLLPGSEVPGRLLADLWQKVTESRQTGAEAGDEGAVTLAKQLHTSLLNVAVTNVDQVDALVRLMQTCMAEQSACNREQAVEASSASDAIISLGTATISLVSRQERELRAFDEDIIRKRQAYAELAEAARQRDEPIAPFVPPSLELARYDFDSRKMEACRLMVRTSLAQKARFLLAAPAAPDAPLSADIEMKDVEVAVTVGEAESQAECRERLQHLEECSAVLGRVTELAVAKIPSPMHLQQLAAEMLKEGEFRLALRILSTALETISKLSAALAERQETTDKLKLVKQEVMELLAQKMKPDTALVEKLKQLELQVQFMALDPQFMRMTAVRYGELLATNAEQMVSVAINSYSSLQTSERFTVKETEEVVAAACAALADPSAIVRVADFCYRQRQYSLVQQAGLLALVKLQAESTAFEEQRILDTEVNLLKSEIADLTTRFNREADDSLTQRLAELESPGLPLAPYYRLSSGDAYDKQLHEVAEKMFNAIVAKRTSISARLQELSTKIDADEAAQASLEAELTAVTSKLPEVFSRCLKVLDSPLYLHRFLVTVGKAGELSLCLQVGRKIHDALDDLDEALIKRFDPTYELKMLRKKAHELWAMFQHKQMLPTEDRARLVSLRLAEKLHEGSRSHHALSASQLASLGKKTITATVGLLQSAQTIAFTRLDALHTEARRPPCEDTLLTAEMIAAAETRRVNEKADIMAQLAEYRQLMARVISDSLVAKRLSASAPIKRAGPGTLLSIAECLCSPAVHTYDFADKEANLTHAASLTSRILPLVVELEAERKRRLPTYEHVDNLMSLRNQLVSVRKTLSEEQEKELAAGERQISQWKEEVAFHNLNATKLAHYAFKSIQQQLMAVLNRKMTLCKRIDALEQEHEAAESRAAARHAETQMADADDMDTSGATYLAKELQSYYEDAKNTARANLQLVDGLLTQVLQPLFDGIALQNASHINQLAATLKRALLTDSKTIVPLVSRVTETSFSAIDALAVLLKERSPLLEELEELQDEEEQLKQVSKTLPGPRLERLKELRHLQYGWLREEEARSSQQDVLDSCTFTACQELLQAFFVIDSDLQSKLTEAKREMAQVNDGSQLDLVEQLEAELAANAKTMSDTLPKLLEHVASPWDLLRLQTQCKDQAQVDLVHMVAHDLITKTRSLDLHRQHLCTMERKMYLLRMEEAHAVSRNKPFDASRKQLLDDLEAKFLQEPDLTYGMSSSYVPPEPRDDGRPSDESKAYNCQDLASTCTKALEASLDSCLRALQTATARLDTMQQRAIAEQTDAYASDIAGIQALVSRLEGKREELLTYAFAETEKLTCYPTAIKLAAICRQNNWYFGYVRSLQQVLKLGHALRIAEQERQDTDVLERKRLTAEQKQQQAKRLDLSHEDEATLRDLVFSGELRKVLPPHQRKSVSDYSAVLFKHLKELLSSCLAQKQQREAEIKALQANPQLVRAVSLSQADIDARQKEASTASAKELQDVVEATKTYLLDPSQLFSVFETLKHHGEVDVMVSVGRHAQRLLAEQLGQQITFEAYSRRLQQLREHPQSDAEEVAAMEEAVEDLRRVIEKQPWDMKQIRSTIRSMACSLIDAALKQNGAESATVVREQSILVFKLELTYDKFEEVRNLVGPKEWPALRKELLDVVMAYDTTLPGSVIDIKTQLDLLLREGLYDDALRICPEPPRRDAHGSDSQYAKACEAYGEVLQMLWFEVEKICPDDLAKVLALIEPFAKLQFQLEHFAPLEVLLDGVQLYFPDKVVDIYTAGSEVLVANMSAKTYSTYVDFLMAVKKRLLGMKLHDEWTAFITQARMEQKRKKKLIQLMNVADLK